MITPGNAGEARLGLRTSPRSPVAAVVNSSAATALTNASADHTHAHALPLRNLGVKSRQLHCVICGEKTSTYCSVCPSSSSTCVAVHAPVDFNGKRRQCFTLHCQEPGKRARSAPAVRAAQKRSAPASAAAAPRRLRLE